MILFRQNQLAKQKCLTSTIVIALIARLTSWPAMRLRSSYTISKLAYLSSTEKTVDMLFDVIPSLKLLLVFVVHSLKFLQEHNVQYFWKQQDKLAAQKNKLLLNRNFAFCIWLLHQACPKRETCLSTFLSQWPAHSESSIRSTATKFVGYH